MSFDDDWAAANGLLAEVYGELVAIARAGVTVTGVTATPSLSDFSAEAEAGFRVEAHQLDFVIAVDDYDFGSGAVEPRAGDRITRAVDGSSVVHEVANRGREGAAAEYADTAEQDWLIHTNRVDG